MSLLADRQALAAALSTVTGVTGYPDPDQQLVAPGDASPRWTGLEPLQGAQLIFMPTWEIIVVGGRTPSEGLAFIDANLANILAAIAPQLLYITGVRPSVIETPNGNLFGVVITGEKES